MSSINSTFALRHSIIAASRSASVFATRPSLIAQRQLYKPLTQPRFYTMADSAVHNLASAAEWDAAIAGDRLVVLDCFATWCGPCKIIAPKFKEFSATYTDASFYKIDVDELPDVAASLGISAMPTFLLYKGGKRVGEVVGANPKALEAAIKEGLGQA